MTIHQQIVSFIVSVGYIGKIKYAPGTFGSLVAFPLCYIVIDYIVNNQVIFTTNNALHSLFIILLLITMLLFVIFIIGAYATSIYLKTSDQSDPQEVVIDELVGQMLVIIATAPAGTLMYNTSISQYLDVNIVDFIFLFILPFILFRVFDIVKPWPIDWLDQNIKGAIGIMIDDIAAALFSIVVYYTIILIII